MAIIQNRLSTVSAPAAWIPPDDLDRPDFLTDYEAGPIALSDSSEGSYFQKWTLTYNGINGQFVLTPELVGSPVVGLTHMGVTQCTLAFDQNGHQTFAFTAGGLPKLYWYNTLVAAFVTTTLAAGTTFPTICLDDKRYTQNGSSDILLFYTRPVGDGVFNLYFRMQRERYETERLLKAGTLPYMYKAGMNYGNRVQIALLDSASI